MGYRILPSVSHRGARAWRCVPGAAGGRPRRWSSARRAIPEALNPQIVTTTTGMNAGRPMFNNLVEFVKGSDGHRARPRGELDSFGRTARNTSSACARA